VCVRVRPCVCACTAEGLLYRSWPSVVSHLNGTEETTILAPEERRGWVGMCGGKTWRRQTARAKHRRWFFWLERGTSVERTVRTGGGGEDGKQRARNTKTRYVLYKIACTERVWREFRRGRGILLYLLVRAYAEGDVYNFRRDFGAKWRPGRVSRRYRRPAVL